MDFQNQTPVLKKLALKHVVANQTIQPRQLLNPQTVAEYADHLRKGAKFPPGVVFFDGSTNWLAGGFTRYYAHEQAGLRHAEYLVYKGTFDDAWLFARGDNKHGVRLTNEEKRQSVTDLLKSPLTSAWSNNAIALHIGVSDTFVGKIRTELTSNVGSETPQPSVRMGRDGRVINTATIGAKPAQSNGYEVVEQDDVTYEELPLETPEEAAPAPEAAPAGYAIPEVVPAQPAQPQLIEAPGAEPELPLEDQIRQSPLYVALAQFPHGGNMFLQQARISVEQHAAITACHRALKGLQYTSGPVTDLVRSVASIRPWTEWEGCSSCHGSTRVNGDPCPRCRGGFTVHAGEGVAPDVVAAAAAGAQAQEA